MYTRYIPQTDGTYRRSRIPDKTPPPPRPEPKPEPCPPPAAECRPEADQQEPQRPRRPQQCGSCQRPRQDARPCQQGCRERKEIPIGNFLRQLLPKNFDTGDLLVVLLLLLMAGDCSEEQNTALLTLVLYLFM